MLLASQVRMLANRVNEFSMFDVRWRIYAKPLLRARPVNKGGVIGPHTFPPPTHAEPAARVCSHRDAVTRKLKKLEAGGLLQRHRGAVVIAAAAQPAKLISSADQ